MKSNALRARGAAALVAVAVAVSVVACSNGGKANDRDATQQHNDAVRGQDSVGSATTGTGVNQSGGPTGYAPPGQGGAMSDTLRAGGARPAGAPNGPTTATPTTSATSGNASGTGSAATGARRP